MVWMRNLILGICKLNIVGELKKLPFKANVY
ncbi:hypothetical protein EDD65_10838 [Keratinibaculum paraultunense]|uniref:Uncharacterized protein n=1 Tax=Keratinibaculum paraultunense TaxID=1278232 RepID=A0A4R3KV14_9FIRM|nr:hypothetical protein EDD65_10838 [Keratinibaculum paraultunense]